MKDSTSDKIEVELCLKVAFEKWMNMGYMQELDEVNFWDHFGQAIQSSNHVSN